MARTAQRNRPVVDSLLGITDRLSNQLAGIPAAGTGLHIYNPLIYAGEVYRRYISAWAPEAPRAILLGMNPGPWGMAQTGVPFGDIVSVRDWMGITGTVEPPADEHPSRPIRGFSCSRREVSGRRLWGWAHETFGPPERFFEHFFVLNYCPLLFFTDTGKNLTPDKLPVSMREPLLTCCDKALVDTLKLLQPRWALGIGRFAEQRLRSIRLFPMPEIIGVPHPSPANPAANKGWSRLIRRALKRAGVPLPPATSPDRSSNQ